jgi:hypothetical protein
MAGPVVPHLVLPQNVLDQRAPDGAARNQMSTAVQTTLAEQAAAYEQKVQPELAAFSARWKAIEPQLVVAAGIDTGPLRAGFA